MQKSEKAVKRFKMIRSAKHWYSNERNENSGGQDINEIVCFQPGLFWPEKVDKARKRETGMAKEKPKEKQRIATQRTRNSRDRGTERLRVDGAGETVLVAPGHPAYAILIVVVGVIEQALGVA